MFFTLIFNKCVVQELFHGKRVNINSCDWKLVKKFQKWKISTGRSRLTTARLTRVWKPETFQKCVQIMFYVKIQSLKLLHAFYI